MNESRFLVFRLGNLIEIKIHNYFDKLWIKLAKFHIIFLTTCCLPFAANFFYNYFFGHQVTLEFQYAKDMYWIRNLQQELTTAVIKDRERLTSSVVRCKSHCRPSCATNLSVEWGSECTSYPLIIDDSPIIETALRRTTRAKASLPCFLKLAESGIPGANKGVFTNVFLPNGLLFGPYTGFIKLPNSKGQDPELSWYAWKVNLLQPVDKIKHVYIDADDELFSNWMRWVNAARYEEEQNMVPLLFNESVYYYLYKDVQPGEELFVWYGAEYAKYLAITVLPGGKHDWDSDFAPAKSVVLCPTCTWSSGFSNISINGTYLDHDTEKEEENETNQTSVESS